MSYAEPRLPPSAAPRSAPAQRALQPGHHTLSANAEAWRRLAKEGYHRTAELVRATCPAPLRAEADGHEHSPADTHQSGFQSL
ncbi:hypothetical protein [Rhodoferax bucti]|uniref:hypothetical protein n=1 Tax=Rhodoferax bucti TaxID=2576305 RepID=UPI001108543B|nr:hypothetical protein [Rhodoferax bucti]